MIRKALIISIGLLFTLCSFAQVVDNFSDGNFTLTPVWNGDNANYEIDGAFTLHLNAPATTDTSYLSTQSTAINSATWEFFVRMTFNPSSSNYSKIYLVSDQADLKGTLNGYFVKIGNTTDEISLYRQDGLSETEIIDGIDDRVDINPVNVSIRVTRDNLGNWQVLSDTTGGTTYVLEGSALDATYSTTSYFGISSRYTSTRSTRFYYDNFNVIGAGFVDVLPPSLDSVVVVNSTNLDVYFNEPVSLSTSQILANYSANFSVGNPNLAVRDAIDSSLVHLTFGSAFTSGQNYDLTITNVEDTVANAITSIVAPFTYLLVVNPNVGDVIINEIFSDPNPQVGLPSEEFVELYNASTSAFILNNWQFINTTTVKTLPNYILQANSYVILCDINDTLLYTPYGDVIGIPSFSALTNGGDSLTLMDNTSNSIDAVAYNISWYQDGAKDDGGYSLERINPTHPCSNALNWVASNDASGGTPGAQNSVFNSAPDAQSPTIHNIGILNTTQINVLFNETMDSASIANATYTLTGGISVANVVVNNNLQSVSLALSSALDSSTVYTLTIAGANDCSGNLLATNTFNFGIGKAPQKYEIIINELYPDPTPSNGLPLADYLELYNTTNKIIDLTNCWIADLTSMDQLNAGKILPGEHIIICDNGFESEFSPFGKVITVNSLPSLNNAEDVFTLFSPDTTLIHSVHYFDEWYRDENKKDGGWSLEMIDPNNPCGEAENWIASTQFFGGTPGTQNTAFGTNPDVVLPKIIEANALNDSTVVVAFNEPLDNEGMLAAIYTIDNSIAVGTIQIIDTKNAQLILNSKLTFQVKYTVEATGAFDCVGNVIGSDNTAIFALPEQGFSEDIVINEILFNPFNGGSDFVEIYNNSNKFINLQNWSLANLENDSIDNYKTLTDQPKLILPGDFILLTKDGNGVEQDYLNSVTDAFLQMETLPTYSNDKGNVYLINNLNMVVDEFHYTDKMHFELLNSEDGVSLERIDYDRLSNDNTNWHSAAEDAGFATPGFENSQYQNTNNSGKEVNVEPATFSPDNDGVDDVLNITYNFSEPGFVATIIIYDTKGRLVKNLVQNELVGISGTFSWDGINERNEKARVGIYIIFVEAYSADGDVKSFKKTAVLAGHLE